MKKSTIQIECMTVVPFSARTKFRRRVCKHIYPQKNLNALIKLLRGKNFRKQALPSSPEIPPSSPSEIAGQQLTSGGGRRTSVVIFGELRVPVRVLLVAFPEPVRVFVSNGISDRGGPRRFGALHDHVQLGLLVIRSSGAAVRHHQHLTPTSGRLLVARRRLVRQIAFVHAHRRRLVTGRRLRHVNPTRFAVLVPKPIQDEARDQRERRQQADEGEYLHRWSDAVAAVRRREILQSHVVLVAAAGHDFVQPDAGRDLILRVPVAKDDQFGEPASQRATIAPRVQVYPV